MTRFSFSNGARTRSIYAPVLVALATVSALLVAIPDAAVAMKAQETAQETTEQEIDAEFLWDAAKSSDVDGVKKALDAGVDVNSETRYGSTALFYACDRGNVEIAEMLLAAGANPNQTDTFYNATPMTWAQSNQHYDIVALLLKNGVSGADVTLIGAASSGNEELVTAIIAAEAASPTALALARSKATKDEIKALFEELDLEEVEMYQPPADLLDTYVGKYSGSGGMAVVVTRDDEILKLAFGSSGGSILEPLAEHQFLMGASSIVFTLEDEEVSEVVLTMGGRAMAMTPVTESDEDAEEDKDSDAAKDDDNEGDGEAEMPVDTETETPAGTPEATPVRSGMSDAEVSSANWPAFRGTGARGVADGQNPPITWNVEEDQNVRWKTPIPGLGNSCPAIWGDRIFITTAFSEDADDDMRIGLYGDVASVEDDSVYDFIVYCVDKNSGEILWQDVVNQTKPAVKRHSKSSHANPTCATDGKYVVAFFGSEGLYCYTAEGEPKWKLDLGVLDSGWFYDAGYQWGFGASPVIFEDRVIVQCDIQKDSFIAAYDLESGSELWKTPREEIPGWSSPVVHKFDDVAMLLTHGTIAARGYDAMDGKELWSMAEHSEIVVPTPFVAHDLIYIASGYIPIQPIVAIHPDARGDIQLAGRKMADGTEAPPNSPDIAWGQERGGTYMPTPIVYGDYLYTCANNGTLTCRDAVTGKEVYKKRMRAPGGTLAFTGSPLAADGHLYMTAEDGRTLVVKAGEEFELVATNKAGGYVMTTPAISEGTFYIRTKTDLIAITDAGEMEDESGKESDDK